MNKSPTVMCILSAFALIVAAVFSIDFLAQIHQKNTEFFNAKITDWFVVFETAILSLATIGLYISTVGLWNSAKEQSKDNQLQQRAYVTPNLYVHIIAPDGPILRVDWSNNGTTPANGMTICCNLKTFPNEIPEDFDFNDVAETEYIRIFLSPKAQTSQLIPISMEEIEKIMAGPHTIYIWGWAEYNDVFANTQRHRIEFCNQLHANRLQDRTMAYAIVGYKKFNGVDKECKFWPARTT